MPYLLSRPSSNLYVLITRSAITYSICHPYGVARNLKILLKECLILECTYCKIIISFLSKISTTIYYKNKLLNFPVNANLKKYYYKSFKFFLVTTGVAFLRVQINKDLRTI